MKMLFCKNTHTIRPPNCLIYISGNSDLILKVVHFNTSESNNKYLYHLPYEVEELQLP